MKKGGKRKKDETPEQSTIRENSLHYPHKGQSTRRRVYENRQSDEVVLFALLAGNSISAE
jgi:hypothetical protein